MYCVVDIETSGGTARSHKIIEVAIVQFDGKDIVDTYSTLINPQKEIPPFITSLTGITNDMVADAPTFTEVADIIFKKTQEAVFVAHNVNFDYSFLKQEFNLLDTRYERKKLCTVRLAKKILPGYRSYSLGALTNQLDIQIDNRHRALGDAVATAKILGILIEKDQGDFIGYSLKRNSREATLPPHIPKSVFDQLPEKAGVYYFHNRKGKVIYVGKAKNIRNRIIGHFTGESGKTKRLFHENLHNISYDLTGNELVALLLESYEIKRLWPEYNRAQKYSSKNHGLFEFIDQKGYQRMVLARLKPGNKPLMTFQNYQEGRSFVATLVRKHHLCARLCGLQKAANACFDHQAGLCDGACIGAVSAEKYNQRYEEARQDMNTGQQTFAIVGEGRTAEENSLVLVERGTYLGHGYFNGMQDGESFDALKKKISSFPDNQDIRKILNMYMKQTHPDHIVYFDT